MDEAEALKRTEATYRSYQILFNSAEGKVVLNDLMRSCFFYRTTAEANPHETYFNEGQRAVVLRILETLKVNITELTDNITKLRGREDVTFFNYGQEENG